MYSKSPLKISKLLFLFIVIMSLSACNTNSNASIMEFSFSTSTLANSSDEKIIYINDDMDKLTLNADLEIDTGEAVIQLLNAANDEIVWNGSYKNNSNFQIDLSDVKEGSEYLLQINATESNKVNLIVSSDEKLVNDKEKPNQYVIEK